MGKKRIIIVEDDNLSLLILKSMIQKLGHVVTGAVSQGDEAIASCADYRPNLVLMDISLSGKMDGIEAARIIKEKFDIPVIFVTSDADEETLQRAKVTDPSGYIIKPITERDLRTTIEMAIYKNEIDKKIKNNAGLLRITLTSIADAVLTTDNNGLITFLNPSAKSLIAPQDWDILGKSFLEVFTILDEEGKSFFERPFLKIIINEEESRSPQSAVLITGCGGRIPIEFVSSPIIDEAGNISGIVVVFRDITERKRNEEATRKALAKEKELNELKSEFISMVSHEFRTPMTSIQASAEFLEKYSDNINYAKKKKNFQRIQNNIKQMTQLLNDVLIIGKTEAGKMEFNPEPVDLTELIETLTEVIESDSRIDEKKRIKMNLAVPRQNIMLDPKLVKQILENLLTNALKYSGAEKEVLFDAATDDKQITFSVKDQGIGIPEEDLKKLFEPFHRAKNVGNISGTGLGLSIVKNAVTIHNGKITVESETGKGTCFVVTLPLIFAE